LWMRWWTSGFWRHGVSQEGWNYEKLDGENQTMSSVVCILHQILWGYQMKDNKNIWCLHGDEKCEHSFGVKAIREETTRKT
jgi:hypothetical protein